MKRRFYFVVTCADFEPWIEGCLRSIDAQEHDELGLLIAFDAPRDGSVARAERCIAAFENVRHVEVRVHEERAGKAQRVAELMECLRYEAGALCAFLDGDDRLIHTQAARRMELEFERGADVAWSNFVYREAPRPGLAGAAGLCRAVEADADPYAIDYASSHLFCFRAGDFFDIDPVNFRDETGAFFRRGCDQCFTLPLVARTRRRAFVPEFFVEYNNATPWQNPGDGAQAAEAVACVRRRGLSRGCAAARARALAQQIAAQLAELQLAHGDFPQPSSYGVACARAAWQAIDPERYGEQIRRAEQHVRGRQHAAARAPQEWPDYHWEFELFAATSGAERQRAEDLGMRTDNRRVLNWQLLLALVDLRLGLPLREGVLERVAANTDDEGRVADFDRALDARAPHSDQYQAFSAFLLDEIAREAPEHAGVAELAERCGAHVVARARGGDVNRDGRGRRQLFGYAAALRVLLTRGEDALAHDVLDMLQAARWEPGLFPLCLDDAQRHFGMQESWHGYNRYFDYAAFTCLLFSRARARRAVPCS